MASRAEVAARREQVVNFLRQEKVPCTMSLLTHRLFHFEAGALKNDVSHLVRAGKVRTLKFHDLAMVAGRGKAQVKRLIQLV